MLRLDFGEGEILSKKSESTHIRTALILVTSLALLVFSTYHVLNYSVDQLVRKDAESQARSWANYLASSLIDIEQIAAGSAPSPASKTFIKNAKSIGDVFRFKLFNGQGRVRLVSDELDRVKTSNPNLARHNPLAARVLSSKQAFTAVKEGIPPERPLLYAETYVPIIKDGQTVAIVEVYVDQTANQQRVRSQFAVSAIALMVITILGFGIPATALYFRTRQKSAADERIHFLGHHDVMTSLINRANFTEKLSEKLSGSRQGDAYTAVHYINFDHFKKLNDLFGHHVGDEFLGIAANRLRAIVRDGDLVSRFGSDEFAVAQFGVESPEDAESFADRALMVLGQPTTASDHDITTTASIGIAIAPRDGKEAISLLKNADTALYKAKSDGRNRHRLFNPEMNQELEARRNLERAIRTAVENNGFDLYFQPLYDIKRSKLMGFEALLRLPDGENGFIPPDRFIPIAEEMGLILQIGEWVLMRACSVASDWPEHLTVAVNLSPEQFKGEGVFDAVSKALNASGLSPSRLELEITEGLLMEDSKAVMKQLEALKQLGTAIAMDDFGTGYSSLSYLWRFPFDKLKIDRSFMPSAGDADPNVVSILSTIVALGHSLNMQVTAEGVEYIDQALLLKKLGCDRVQGFLFGRPMPQGEVALLVLQDFTSTNQDAIGSQPLPKLEPVREVTAGDSVKVDSA